ncbi:hypothetical protein VDGD_21251 [Verticillium dahliae]|nr:hypothetical protein VDGD_21251 [Verticillium dahliae]
MFQAPDTPNMTFPQRSRGGHDGSLARDSDANGRRLSDGR